MSRLNSKKEREVIPLESADRLDQWFYNLLEHYDKLRQGEAMQVKYYGFVAKDSLIKGKELLEMMTGHPINEQELMELAYGYCSKHFYEILQAAVKETLDH